MASEEMVGRGDLLSGGPFDGRVVRADGVEEVLELLRTDLEEAVLVTDQASATSYAPILPRLRGIVCEGGGEAAHLTIVSRGLGLPCVMRAQLERPPRVGERIGVGEDGSITLGPA